MTEGEGATEVERRKEGRQAGVQEGVNGLLCRKRGKRGEWIAKVGRSVSYYVRSTS